MAQSPSVPSGTRDFSPAEMARRNYIFDTIKGVFCLYGFQAIETPAMENLSTLLGKYGNEGDKLLFKILNSGDAFAKITADDLPSFNSTALKVCEKGLRYDLTVPFARYVVQHQNDIAFPFRRYQIQPVWRADRPQKGRYREFYQCDVDVIGSTSLLNEVELMQMIDEVYKKLNISITLKINNRKVLSGMAEVLNAQDKLTDITVAIDKIDKIGIEKVNAELAERGLNSEAIAWLQPILQSSGSNTEKLQLLQSVFQNSPTGLQGVQELQTIFDYLAPLGLHCKVELDLSLARGLNYYTGAIFEVKANDAAIGSITGGGRYDNLTGVFGLNNVSGVGVSFGADRIYDVMEQLALFPVNTSVGTSVIFANLGEQEEKEVLQVAAQLRSSGIATEIYPERRKLQKQFEYANKRGIPYVVVIGENEMQQQKVNVKNMQTGEQQLLTQQALLQFLLSQV
ncbi:histidine--tRNA ligase [Bacteroidia bacterium]|nr:histidine--tRNA ligase [Bacteroidia bacterium]